MSQAHIERFYAIAANDDGLLARLMADTDSPEAFIARAVKEGSALGYDFTVEEAAAWIRKEQDIKASGELSDSQLESVAGGKGGPYDPNEKAHVGRSRARGRATAIETLGRGVGSWVSSW